jgi:hypothetical protein
MSDVNESIRNLPVIKHFSEEEIKKNINSFKKGEKPFFWILLLLLVGAIGFGLAKYALPVAFVMLGKAIGVVAVGVFLIFMVIIWGTLMKAIRALAKTIAKKLIAQDPFGELEKQKRLMIQNQQTFRVSKGTINSLRTDCEAEAAKNEKDAKSLSSKILTLNEKAKTLKMRMEEMVKTGGIKAKESDDYVNDSNDFLRTVSESQRVSSSLEQAKDFVQKYGARAAIMKKFGQKLSMVETSMDIKIQDFDATIEILKKDYDFASKSRQATDAAKSAMGFTKGWELDYALDVVTSTIASDIAITSGNLKDIDYMTKNYAIDSDELYTNLDSLANNIRIGNEIIPEAKTYNNPEYRLTQSDSIKAGGFDNIF